MEYYQPYLKTYARKLRSNMTDAEIILWAQLRRKQICGIQFYRQYAFQNYILDFYAPKIKLAIELDGEQHYFAKGQVKDKQRDQTLSKYGVQTLRFNNIETLKELSTVTEKIYLTVQSRLKK